MVELHATFSSSYGMVLQDISHVFIAIDASFLKATDHDPPATYLATYVKIEEPDSKDVLHSVILENFHTYFFL